MTSRNRHAEILASRSHANDPEFEDSGVTWLGRIPRHWSLQRLRYVLSMNPSPVELDGLPVDTEVSFVPMDSVGAYGGLNLSQSKRLDELGAGFTYFRDDDVVVAKITPCFENWKGAHASGLLNGVAFGTTELHVLRPGETLDARFLFYITLSDPFRKLGEAEMFGAGGQKRVPAEFIRDLKWPVPPLAEQRTISAVLDTETDAIDRVIAKHERLIDLLEAQLSQLTTAAVTRSVGREQDCKPSAVPSLSRIPRHWSEKRLKHLALGLDSGIQMGPFGSMLTGVVEHETGYKLYGQENTISGDFRKGSRWLTRETFHELIQYALREGDIVVTRKGSIGNARVFGSSNHRGIFDSDTIRIRADGERISADFLQALLHRAHYISAQILGNRRGAVLGGLNTTNIADLVLAVPPIEEQKLIVQRIQNLDAEFDGLKLRLLQLIRHLRDYRSSIISAAVTGKLKLRTRTP